MPPIRRSNLGRRTRRAIISQNVRDNQTQEERAEQNEWRRAHIAQVRAAQSPPQIRQNVTRRRPLINVGLNRAAFEYDSAIAYKDLRCVHIGSLSVVCQHCNALKFQSETPGLCCAGGKVKLPVLTHPPEPLYSLLYGNTMQSKHFLANTQKYNGCFQMTSFGAEVVDAPGYNPSYKVMTSHYYQNEQFFLFFRNCFKTFRFKDKFTIERALCYHYRMKIISSFRSISLVIRQLNLISVVQFLLRLNVK